jgi:hypothetical protein
LPKLETRNATALQRSGASHAQHIPRNSIVDFFKANLASLAIVFSRRARLSSVISVTCPNVSQIVKAMLSCPSHPG